MKQFYRVVRDGNPIESGGKECHYSRGEAIKKARMFNGKIQALSEEENNQKNLKEALANLKYAFCEVLKFCDDEKEFGEKYSFNKNFREVVDDVIEWVESEVS